MSSTEDKTVPRVRALHPRRTVRVTRLMAVGFVVATIVVLGLLARNQAAKISALEEAARSTRWEHEGICRSLEHALSSENGESRMVFLDGECDRRLTEAGSVPMAKAVVGLSDRWESYIGPLYEYCTLREDYSNYIEAAARLRREQDDGADGLATARLQLLREMYTPAHQRFLEAQRKRQ
jgi:hypothetical protein